MTTPARTPFGTLARSKPARITLSAIAGLGVIGGLAACSNTATAEDEATTGSSASASPSTGSTAAASDDAATDDSAASGAYADGEYSASGSYQTPNGTEEIEVSITLAGDVVTAVEITSNPTNPNTKQYQGEFKDGIDAEVVGKSLDEISVDKVGGSSLTSGGFTEALETIKTEAAA